MAISRGTRRPLTGNAARKRTTSKTHAFDIEAFLESTGLGKSVSMFKQNDTIFSQGDPAKEVFYIQKGSVKLIVVNQSGREAVMAILGAGDFLGEGCLTTQSSSIATASCLSPTTLFVMKKKEMIQVLGAEQAFSRYF